MVGGSSLEGFTVSSANKVMVRRHILLGVRMHGKGVVLMLVGLLELLHGDWGRYKYLLREKVTQSFGRSFRNLRRSKKT